MDLHDDSGYRRNWTDKKISVIITDEHFNIIGETDLPASRYLISNCFVTEKGFHISTNNESNPALNEDYIRFDIFEVSCQGL